jgi:hypothetical protein
MRGREGGRRLTQELDIMANNTDLRHKSANNSD